MDKYFLLTFNNTHSAITGEKICKENNIEVVVMPTPTSITKSCGISLRIPYNFEKCIKNLITEEKISIKGIYVKNGIEYSVVEL